MKLNSARRPHAAHRGPAVTTALVLVLVLATSILAGCGAGQKASPTAAAAGPSQTVTPAKASAGSTTKAADPTAAASAPCSLLTNDDIATVTGLPMTVSGTDGSVTCIYLSADKTMEFSVQILANRAAMATLLQLEAGSEHLSGFGDDAFWSSGGVIFVRVGDRAFSLSSPAAFAGGAAAKAAMTLLATHALAKF